MRLHLEVRSLPGPTLTFGFVIATLLGAGFHLIFGGDARRLAMFLLAGWVGFVLGHMVGDILDFVLFNAFNVGALHLLPAAIGAIVALVFTQIVTSRRNNKNRRTSR